MRLAECAVLGPVRLNLGAGPSPIEGYLNLDGAQGDVLYPLAYPADSVDEIRASHVLEHFPHGQVQAVLDDWVRALKPGGVLKIAVPDFETLARAYLDGARLPIQGYVMGGQTDARDYHHALFDAEALQEELQRAGLIAVRRWHSEIDDCAALPISLNLAGTKPGGKWPRIACVMSVPRLGFLDNSLSLGYLHAMGVHPRKATGAYWGQCMTRGIEEALAEDDPEWILTVDYDTVFAPEQVSALVDIAQRHPEVDALAPIQIRRAGQTPLFLLQDQAGKARPQIAREELRGELLEARTAHFGLTLLRAEKVRALPRPWFASQPDASGRWEEGRMDDDIWFWHQWANAGNHLHIATRVPVGHAQLLVTWPDVNLQALHQDPSQFWRDGPPQGLWR